MSAEPVVLEERRRIRDDEVERIPWREFVRNQFKKILGFLLLLVILFVIITLSRAISPDATVVNPDNVIGLGTSDHVILMFMSSVLFLSVLGVFTKVVLVDHREEFGITSWKQPRVSVTFLLTTSFISLVYILLDIALINIYMMTLPTWVIWSVQSLNLSLDQVTPDAVDRLAYSTIRGYIFVALLALLFVFPITMFVGILTRIGRQTITKQRQKERRLPTTRLVLGLVLSGGMSAVTLLIYQRVSNELAAAILLFLGLGFLLALFTFAFLLLINGIRFVVFLTYSNFLLIFPFIFLFYLLPAGLWGLWDLIVIVTTGGVDNTIYAILPHLTPAVDPRTTNISSLSSFSLIGFYLQTVRFNLQSVIRIVQLDFILVVGLSALVIGFAEGYSILSIFGGIIRGVSIAKTGKVASRSAPRIIVITSRLFYLAAWLSFFWDNLIVLGQAVSDSLNLSFSFFQLPQFLSIVVDFSFRLGGISDVLLVLTILAVPFYFILSSSFKFLSVSLVLEKVRDDKQMYYLLISSAYILIVTNIFADIASLPDFLGDHKQFLPLSGAATENFLPFVAKIFEVLESVAFYVGVIATIIVGLKRVGSKEEAEEGSPEIPEELPDSGSVI